MELLCIPQKRRVIYFCSADIGWITGHSYLVYGPLLAGGTSLMFEGIPTWPDAGRFWNIVDKHRVNQFYTAPTAIRSLMALGLEWLENKDLSDYGKYEQKMIWSTVTFNF